MDALLALLLVPTAIASAELPPPTCAAILNRIAANSQRFEDLSRAIWETPEIAFTEVKSSALGAAELRAAGFRVTQPAGGLPTAFIAEWGSGSPVIGIIGEYDALPGLSQQDTPEKRARVAGAPGHGCGHNLFGAASALAAVAVKQHLEATGGKGTVRFFGTPAEESGAGKVYLLRAGVFKDADVVLVWHPWDANYADNQGWLANINAKFRFHGLSAHAAAAPEAGRSALDAVEVMTHAVNLLREHVPQETRLHYIVTSGGNAANIVPDFAELSLIARHPDLARLEGIWERVLNCAQAGALASGTRMEFEVVSSYANYVPVPALVSLLDRSLRAAGGVQYSAAERAFAETVRRASAASVPLGAEAVIGAPTTRQLAISTDVGDVSWNVPTGQFFAATFPPGVPLHSWQSTATAGTSVGRKGMLVAARTLALAAVELLTDPALVEAARRDWAAAKAGRSYRSLLPANKTPPLAGPLPQAARN